MMWQEVPGVVENFISYFVSRAILLCRIMTYSLSFMSPSYIVIAIGAITASSFSVVF